MSGLDMTRLELAARIGPARNLSAMERGKVEIGTGILLRIDPGFKKGVGCC
jgi:hypothetical protein